VIRPLVEQDSKTLQRLLPEIPQWVKNPDYDRVCYSLELFFHPVVYFGCQSAMCSFNN
jgi:hypothetical protein